MAILLICPGYCSQVRALSEFAPLAAIPVMGQSLLEYWLAHLASGLPAAVEPASLRPEAAPSRFISIVAPDRPDHIRQLVGGGERWGLDLTILSAIDSTASPIAGNRAPSPDIRVLDHFPGQPQFSLFSNYSNWFAGLLQWMPRAQTPDRVGIRQMTPGVWISSTARISSRAELHAPCWIGSHVTVGPRASVGPRAIVERGSFIEGDSEVAFSYVAPGTYIGAYAEVQHSLVLGSKLIDWQTGSEVIVTDSFLLSSFNHHVADQSIGATHQQENNR